MMQYGTLDLSKFEQENADTTSVVQALINERANNRSDRRKIAKALGKVGNRDKYYTAQRVRDTVELRKRYQQELDKRIDNATAVVHDGLVDNWTKMMALMALVLKRKYNWSDGRIGMLIEKANELHKDMVISGEWDDLPRILEEECGIELEVSDD